MTNIAEAATCWILKIWIVQFDSFEIQASRLSFKPQALSVRPSITLLLSDVDFSWNCTFVFQFRLDSVCPGESMSWHFQIFQSSRNTSFITDFKVIVISFHLVQKVLVTYFNIFVIVTTHTKIVGIICKKSDLPVKNRHH